MKLQRKVVALDIEGVMATFSSSSEWTISLINGKVVMPKEPPKEWPPFEFEIVFAAIKSLVNSWAMVAPTLLGMGLAGISIKIAYDHLQGERHTRAIIKVHFKDKIDTVNTVLHSKKATILADTILIAAEGFEILGLGLGETFGWKICEAVKDASECTALFKAASIFLGIGLTGVASVILFRAAKAAVRAAISHQHFTGMAKKQPVVIIDVSKQDALIRLKTELLERQRHHVGNLVKSALARLLTAAGVFGVAILSCQEASHDEPHFGFSLEKLIVGLMVMVGLVADIYLHHTSNDTHILNTDKEEQALNGVTDPSAAVSKVLDEFEALNKALELIGNVQEKGDGQFNKQALSDLITFIETKELLQLQLAKYLQNHPTPPYFDTEEDAVILNLPLLLEHLSLEDNGREEQAAIQVLRIHWPAIQAICSKYVKEELNLLLDAIRRSENHDYVTFFTDIDDNATAFNENPRHKKPDAE